MKIDNIDIFTKIMPMHDRSKIGKVQYHKERGLLIPVIIDNDVYYLAIDKRNAGGFKWAVIS